jgi:hypothetical protein
MSDALAKLRYFFLSSSKLEPKHIRKTHPRLILAFSKADLDKVSPIAREKRGAGMARKKVAYVHQDLV